MLQGIESLYPDYHSANQNKVLPILFLLLRILYCIIKYMLQEVHCCLRLIDLSRSILIKFHRLLHKKTRAYIKS
jgi:hypothetical protein